MNPVFHEGVILNVGRHKSSKLGSCKKGGAKYWHRGSQVPTYPGVNELMTYTVQRNKPQDYILFSG